jgi:hypothetical protein
MTTLNEEVTSCYPGESDERVCGSNVGVCVAGTQTRVCGTDGFWGIWGECTGSVGPSEVTETSCNDGEDNDCDGLTDFLDTSDCTSTDDNTFATLTWVTSAISDMATKTWVNSLGFALISDLNDLESRINAVEAELDEKQDELTGDESVFSNWDKNAADDFDGQYSSLVGAPTGLSAFSNDEVYITSYTETDPLFTAWNKSTGISITESQIIDLQDYLTSEADPSWNAEKNNYYTKTEINATLASEQSTRNSADTALQSNITAEALARSNADASLESRAAHNEEGVDIYLHYGWNTFKMPWFVLTGTDQTSRLNLANYNVESVLGSINGEYTYLAYYDGSNWQTYIPGGQSTFTVFPTGATNADFDFHIYVNSTDGARIEIGLED